jgi:hypothetical protein
MDLRTTLFVLALGIAIPGVALWLERRPKNALDVRLIPTTPILVVGVLTVLAAAVHLLSFLG